MNEPEDGPAIRAADIKIKAPGLLGMHDQAALSLDRYGLTGQRMAVYLALNHSRTMRPHYDSGAVAMLAESTLALAGNLDDDGVVPTCLFHSEVAPITDIHLDRYEGAVQALSQPHPWGGSDHVAAMDSIIDHYRAHDVPAPALVVFLTDNYPDDPAATLARLRSAAHLPIFWAFVGYGDNVSFLRRMDNDADRVVDNASSFHASRPSAVTSGTLFDGITHEIPRWLRLRP